MGHAAQQLFTIYNGVEYIKDYRVAGFCCVDSVNNRIISS
jgi:hypothetical protein